MFDPIANTQKEKNELIEIIFNSIDQNILTPYQKMLLNCTVEQLGA